LCCMLSFGDSTLLARSSPTLEVHSLFDASIGVR
jgi:hypothetical protein